MKGQWFLLSAVIATGVFLTISVLFKSYLTIDTASVARANEDLYFNNIKDQFALMDAKTVCDEKAMREFRAFVEREVGSLGYLVYISYPPGCSPLGLLVASSRMVVCQNVNAAQILANATVTPSLADITCSTV